MNLRITTSILPVIVFYALTRVAPPWVSILGGFAMATAVFLYNRKDRLISWLTVFGFSVVFASAIVGIVLNSEKAYIAAAPIQDFMFVLIYLASIVVGKPLIGGIAGELLPSIARRIPPNARIFIWLTLLWAVYDLFQGIARVYMLQRLSIGEYLLWSRVLNWPLGAAILAITAWVILREARDIAHASGEPPPRFSFRHAPLPRREALPLAAESTSD